MDIRIGFIGAGNMGSALISGIVKSGSIKPENIFAYDISESRLRLLKSELNINILQSNAEIVEHSDFIVLAVKPNQAKKALEECKHKFKPGKTLISIAAGIPIKAYKEILGETCGIVRAMPNTPAIVGEGMTVVSFDENVTQNQAETVLNIFKCVGKVEMLDEFLMNEVTALTGSSPAYVFMFIEAMADAAVLSGIRRDIAYRLAAQAVLGAAKMVLETGKHPGELKDQVCSPAGTTIEAVSVLEKHGFRFALMDAMSQCTKRSREISKIYG